MKVIKEWVRRRWVRWNVRHPRFMMMSGLVGYTVLVFTEPWGVLLPYLAGLFAGYGILRASHYEEMRATRTFLHRETGVQMRVGGADAATYSPSDEEWVEVETQW
jgi:hypothetical protein